MTKSILTFVDILGRTLAHIVLRRTSSCGAHRPAAHIILLRTSSSCGAYHHHRIVVRRTSSWGAHWRTWFCGAHSPVALHPAAHIIVLHTSSCSAHRHLPAAPRTAAHLIVQLTSCGAHHHLTSSCGRRTSSCGISSSPHTIERRTSFCGAHPCAAQAMFCSGINELTAYSHTRKYNTWETKPPAPAEPGEPLLSPPP
ncbi:unnamed protein product [Pleuronectes platessa]|uniref:Uncharacterized protein n=1 Tax=Pleuronectes platessa TaxID=8262 RepID=A0A9N7TL71_PLEPL|nr:unnamed protein product [Pleuronectes platessa]